MASSPAAQAHKHQEPEENLIRLLTGDKNQQPKGASKPAASLGVARQPWMYLSNPQSSLFFWYRELVAFQSKLKKAGRKSTSSHLPATF